MNQALDSLIPDPSAPADAKGLGAITGSLAIPDDAMILVPVRQMVMFPGLILPVTIGRAQSVAGAQYAVKSERPIGLILQKDPEIEVPGADDICRIGTVCRILRYVTTPDGTHHVVCQGQERFRVLEVLTGYPFLVARVEKLAELEAQGTGDEARFMRLRQLANEALELLPQTPQELVAAVQGITVPGLLADMVTGLMDVKPAEKQAVLEMLEIGARLEAVIGMLSHRVEVLRLSREMDEKAKAKIDEGQKKFILREQMRAIQKELGEDGGTEAEIDDLRKQIAEAQMPKEVLDQANKELKRLSRMQESSGEYSMVRTYLDWLVELPWAEPAQDAIDMAEARRVLDEDHYGLDKIKKRILEFLAVRKLNPTGHSPILCFAGPPGVGKTSLGQSIARALGRKFVRVALGGLHDEAEIRGHRRTYIGALPGTVIQSIKKAGTRGCVMMLDEIDKVGQGTHGDPSAALLEVLDPEQNMAFADHYLDVDYDLSKVMFITTANNLERIPRPLQDRMEIIRIAGYTEVEKLNIAKRYLVPKVREQNGLKEGNIEFSDNSILGIIRHYTKEAGVRSLERELASICRKVVLDVVKGDRDASYVINSKSLQKYLGPEKFRYGRAEEESRIGVTTGLAWTDFGGELLSIEVAVVPGKGRLTITGRLGEVMQESAQAAMSYVRSRADDLGLERDFYQKVDIHLHVPEGATPKDGPSAGITLATSLVSAITRIPVRSDLAMTGEVTLRGNVLPIGGLKEKVLAAHRGGIKHVLIPIENEKDISEIPDTVLKSITIELVQHMDEVLRKALVLEDPDNFLKKKPVEVAEAFVTPPTPTDVVTH